jgi:hypothetical protein
MISATAPVRENTTVYSAKARWWPEVELTPRLILPVSVTLFGPIGPELRIVQPLTINIERDDNSYIASDDVFIMYGLGDDIPSALQDYISVLTEYYDVLSSLNDEPSVELFHHLQVYLRHQ